MSTPTTDTLLGSELLVRLNSLSLHSYDVIPRQHFQPLLEGIRSVSNAPSVSRVNPQRLALLFAILAMGTLHNLETSPNDPSAEEFLGMAKVCLCKGEFLTRGNIAGIQTLVSNAYTLTLAAPDEPLSTLWRTLNCKISK